MIEFLWDVLLGEEINLFVVNHHLVSLQIDDSRVLSECVESDEEFEVVGLDDGERTRNQFGADQNVDHVHLSKRDGVSDSNDLRGESAIHESQDPAFLGLRSRHEGDLGTTVDHGLHGDAVNLTVDEKHDHRRKLAGLYSIAASMFSRTDF